MPTLKGLSADRETLTIKAPDGDLHITYKPSRLSAAYLERYADQMESKFKAAHEAGGLDETEMISIHAELICGVVLEWDCTGPLPDEDVFDVPMGSIVAEGEVIPLEGESLKWLGGATLEYIIEELRKDAGVKVRSRGGSSKRS